MRHGPSARPWFAPSAGPWTSASAIRRGELELPRPHESPSPATRTPAHGSFPQRRPLTHDENSARRCVDCKLIRADISKRMRVWITLGDFERRGLEIHPEGRGVSGRREGVALRQLSGRVWPRSLAWGREMTARVPLILGDRSRRSPFSIACFEPTRTGRLSLTSSSDQISGALRRYRHANERRSAGASAKCLRETAHRVAPTCRG
jgi:hypothetical protein